MPPATITIVAGELPPTVEPTATPNLNAEQVRIGTITVLIFCGLVVLLIAFAIRWMVRGGKRG